MVSTTGMWRAHKSISPEATELIQFPFVIKSFHINVGETITVCNTYVLFRLGTSVACISCRSQCFSEHVLPLGLGNWEQKSLQQTKSQGLSRAEDDGSSSSPQ